MLDIKFVRDNPDAVKENIKKKFQDAKLPLVDENFMLRGLITIKDIEKSIVNIILFFIQPSRYCCDYN